MTISMAFIFVVAAAIANANGANAMFPRESLPCVTCCWPVSLLYRLLRCLAYSRGWPHEWRGCHET
jgi:hypothetical protein